MTRRVCAGLSLFHRTPTRAPRRDNDRGRETSPPGAADLLLRAETRASPTEYYYYFLEPAIPVARSIPGDNFDSAAAAHSRVLGLRRVTPRATAELENGVRHTSASLPFYPSDDVARPRDLSIIIIAIDAGKYNTVLLLLLKRTRLPGIVVVVVLYTVDVIVNVIVVPLSRCCHNDIVYLYVIISDHRVGGSMCPLQSPRSVHSRLQLSILILFPHFARVSPPSFIRFPAQYRRARTPLGIIFYCYFYCVIGPGQVDNSSHCWFVTATTQKT